MQAIVDPVYYKNTQIISPGVVGSVGDVIGGVRLKQSTPDMAMRYDKTFESPITGSNVQDGYSYSYSSGGGPARTFEKTMSNRGFRTVHGWKFQDLRAPDTSMQPVTGSTGRYPWYNKIATVYEAKRTGDLFLPLPNGYTPSGVPRGSQVPRVTDIMEPSDAYLTNLGDQREQPKQLLPNVSQPIVQTPNATRCIKNGVETVTLDVMKNTPSVVGKPPVPTTNNAVSQQDMEALQNLKFF